MCVHWGYFLLYLLVSVRHAPAGMLATTSRAGACLRGILRMEHHDQLDVQVGTVLELCAPRDNSIECCKNGCRTLECVLLVSPVLCVCA
jgi:hypothetical protein